MFAPISKRQVRFFVLLDTLRSRPSRICQLGRCSRTCVFLLLFTLLRVPNVDSPIVEHLKLLLRQARPGDVVVRTDGAACLAVSVDSPHALVGEGAIYAQHADWTAGEAEGFIRMYGQSTALWTEAAAT